MLIVMICVMIFGIRWWVRCDERAEVCHRPNVSDIYI